MNEIVPTDKNPFKVSMNQLELGHLQPSFSLSSPNKS